MAQNNRLTNDTNGFVSKAQRKENMAAKNAPSAQAKLGIGTVIFRIFLSLITLILCVTVTVLTAAYVLLNGPCKPLRDRLVLSAMQASATKWLPGLFLADDTVEQIVANSYVVNTDVISLDEYAAESKNDVQGKEDEWKNAIDGMILENISGATFNGYILLIKDPSRVFVGTSSDFTQGLAGMRIFDIVKKEDAVAAINGGEFADPGGSGTGNTPMGITFARGACVWNDTLKRTFIGFDKDNKLVVTEPMDKKTAESLNIRDGVSFQTGNVLITSDDGNVTMHYADNNTGTAQRTAVGQRADGTVIFLVTDGRSASSLGATKNDVIDVMVKYGAVTAGMLDGGSSSLMYYEDYYTKYDIDESTLDEYQKKGLVNRYKAFTTPRRIPTYFCVAREDTEDSAAKGGDEA